MAKNNYIGIGSGCGTVGRAVASELGLNPVISKDTKLMKKKLMKRCNSYVRLNAHVFELADFVAEWLALLAG